MWIDEESLSECGRMKIVFKQCCDKSKFATDFDRERTIPRTFNCLYIYVYTTFLMTQEHEKPRKPPNARFLQIYPYKKSYKKY